MTESKMRAITIVAKASLDPMLSTRLREWGAAEYSIVRSIDGKFGPHAANGDGQRYSRIETIVSDETAQTIARRLAAEFSTDSSVVCFVSEVCSQATDRYLNASHQQRHAPREQPWGDYLIEI
jgi:hypothetical protein